VNEQLVYQRVNHARCANAQSQRERGHQRQRSVRSQYAPTKPQVLKHFIPNLLGYSQSDAVLESQV
jgi:hypothetical protein